MKALAFLLPLLMASFISHAQVFRGDDALDAARSKHNLSRMKKRIVENHISGMQVTRYKYDKAGMPKPGRLAYEDKFDKDGNIIGYKEFKKNGKPKFNNVFTYNEKGLESEYRRLDKNNKIGPRTEYRYDEAGNLTDLRVFRPGPMNMAYHLLAKFDDKNNMLESRYLIKNDTKPGNRYEYTYYPDGSKKRTVEYNKRNKVMHTWNYECNPNGTLANAHLKDTSKICIRYETDKSGNKVTIKEEMLKLGNVRRVITKYDNNDNMIDVSAYNKRSKRVYEYINTYDGQSRLTAANLYGKRDGRTNKRYEYHYDEKGNITEEVVYNKAPEPSHVFKFSYN
jgi:hypothetical protein